MSCPDKKSQQDQLSWCTKPGHHAAGGGAQGLPTTCNTSNTTGTTATSVTNLPHQFLHRMQTGLALAFSAPDRPGHQLCPDWQDPHSGQDGISGVTYHFLSPPVFCQHRYALHSSLPRISQTRGVYYHFRSMHVLAVVHGASVSTARAALPDTAGSATNLPQGWAPHPYWQRLREKVFQEGQNAAQQQGGGHGKQPSSTEVRQGEQLRAGGTTRSRWMFPEALGPTESPR